ncbi:1,4-dihydroxy-2-naphthoate octaprenyltransferase [Cellulophaga sp. HaHaR_3_176]|uniref:1,4-dihydroxy-2-naphthoate octaprenyltransferase n=1 Tax=Cellulophaga sp. HaHaR_3_176 TaxID=1942464 RepID=UPI001C1F5FC9|nr:1,4-dihydroxy-2-naphthoate octaprenyltransferase [Cellulophaga sp. HaHaR_3_176]QWX85469.1 1,4-dihydroxy-2-naphthoate octaprenyltransferase [Cellulophaga sp. HaHaR_3_176]
MTKFKAWINAARLRTLPLSISGIITGTALADYYGYSNLPVFILALLTTIGFQVTSNFANDYGDGVKGTDNNDRIGPKRALQSGILTRKELKKGIIISAIISILLAIVLLYVAFGSNNLLLILVFFILALVSIWASIKYTVGASAYGYRGLGDVFVFVFFGLLGVLGAMYLFTKFLTFEAILPAIAIGLLSTGVLNLNNLRDCISDKKAGKNTVVVKMGFEKGKIYHYSLLIISFFCMLMFGLINFSSWKNFLYLIVFIPVTIHALKVRKNKNPVLLDPELKKLALSTFFIAILYYISINIFS